MADEWVSTFRFPDDEADLLRMMAQVRGISVNEAVREAVTRRIEELRQDEEFQTRLRRTVEENREILERLAQT